MTSKSLFPRKKYSAHKDLTFRLAFEKHAAIMLLVDPTTRLILDANQTAVQFYGYPKAKLCGMSINNINTLSPEQVGADCQKAMKHEKNYFVYSHKLANEEVRMVEVHTSPISLREKQALFSIIHDISERKRAEEDLKLRESYLSAIIENQPGLVSLKDMQGRFLAVNRAFSISCKKKSSDEILGKTDLEIWPREMAKKYRTDDVEVIKQRTPLRVEESIVDQGQILWFETFKMPVINDSGRVIGTTSFARDITERKRAEQGIHQRVTELEMLYQSGLALSQLLNPKEIGQKILELLEEKLAWQHTRIRLYHAQDQSLELLDFNHPGLSDAVGRHEVVERFQSLVTNANQGMSGWAIQTGRPLRSGDVRRDPHYIEAYPGICSGLYVPMKLGERIIGVISIEDEQPDAFSAEDERLIVTLANQAASAFENARLFEDARQRVMELETLNHISLVLRTVSNQDDMLSIVLDDALAILNTTHGSIELYNKTTSKLKKTITRGWLAQVVEPAHNSNEGITGRVFSSGETYISHEFASDPQTLASSRNQIPYGWGGACVPIRTTQQTMGVLIVSVPSERGLGPNEIRLLSILSEMTGAAMQRMQLHEQTVRRLEQLNALRAVDQAISSSLDMKLTLNILLSHTISQLNADAADVLLLHSGSNLLEMAAERGFRMRPFESITWNTSFARRAIAEHRPVIALELETATLRESPNFVKLWKDEGFVCYWCVPLIVKGEVKGVLEVYNRKAFSPDAEWLEFLEALAGQAAITIENTQLFEHLQRANLDLVMAYDATIEGWSRALDLRDHETEGHTLRVTELTMKLARVMRINETQLTAIRHGALLHDIGKMGVPDSILLKEGNLTEEEWGIMRRHPQHARDMLMPIAYLKDALDIPYSHHEKWDGSGYPQGLKGDHIPLAARIFAVVDVWDALTYDRPYRKKWSKQKTRQYIKEQSGKHFDPKIVEVFLKCIEEG